MKPHTLTTHLLVFLIGIFLGFLLYNYETMYTNVPIVPQDSHYENLSVDSSRMKQLPVVTPMVKVKEVFHHIETTSVKDTGTFISTRTPVVVPEVNEVVDSVFEFEGCYNDSDVTITVKGFVRNGHVDSLGFTYQLNARVYTYSLTSIDTVYVPPATAKELFLIGGSGINQWQKNISCGLLRQQGKIGYGFLATPFLNDYRILFSLRLK